MENVVIDFYKYTGAPNAVDKSASLGSVAMTMDGVFKTPFDVLNPSVIVQPTNVSVRNFLRNRYNYVCVKTFNENDRYYFVDGMRALNDKLVEVDLREDVLMQYKEDIYTLQCFVNRCSSDSYIDAFVEDGARKFRMNRTTTMIAVTPTPSVDSKVNTIFDPMDSGIIVNVLTKAQLVSDTQVDFLYPSVTPAQSFDSGYLPSIDRQGFSISGAEEPTPNPFNEKYSANFHSRVGFLSMDQVNFMAVICEATFNDEVKSAIRGAIAFPFKPLNEDKLISNMSPFRINETTFRIDDGSLGHIWNSKCDVVNPTSGYIVTADFTLPSIASFTDEPPYTLYDIYIPYCGWIDIPVTSLRSRLIVFYVVDYSSGQAQANLYDFTNHIVIWSGSCQLGVKLELTSTNQAEQNRQATSSGLNTILQVGGGAVATIGGAYTANPIAVAGGVMSIARGIGGYATTAINMVDRANVGYSAAATALYQPNQIRVRKRALIPLNSANALKPVVGLPCSKVLTLSALRGTGFANVADVYPHLYSGIMRSEWEEIVRLLKEGVFL